MSENLYIYKTHQFLVGIVEQYNFNFNIFNLKCVEYEVYSTYLFEKHS